MYDRIVTEYGGERLVYNAWFLEYFARAGLVSFGCRGILCRRAVLRASTFRFPFVLLASKRVYVEAGYTPSSDSSGESL
jgi:hypothetical protein